MDRIFIESTLFNRELLKLLENTKLDEDEYKAFQEILLTNPKTGKVIPGLGGVRKIRLGLKKLGKGKSGGLRVDYLDIPEAGLLHLLVLYSKNAKGDIGPKEKKELRKYVDVLKQEAKKNVQRT